MCGSNENFLLFYIRQYHLEECRIFSYNWTENLKNWLLLSLDHFNVVEYNSRAWFCLHGFSFRKELANHFQFGRMKGFLAQLVKSGSLSTITTFRSVYQITAQCDSLQYIVYFVPLFDNCWWSRSWEKPQLCQVRIYQDIFKGIVVRNLQIF